MSSTPSLGTNEKLTPLIWLNRWLSKLPESVRPPLTANGFQPPDDLPPKTSAYLHNLSSPSALPAHFIPLSVIPVRPLRLLLGIPIEITEIVDWGLAHGVSDMELSQDGKSYKKDFPKMRTECRDKLLGSLTLPEAKIAAGVLPSGMFEILLVLTDTWSLKKGTLDTAMKAAEKFVNDWEPARDRKAMWYVDPTEAWWKIDWKKLESMKKRK